MTNRRKFLVLSLAGLVTTGLPGVAAAKGLGIPLNATAITEVFGNGMRLVGVAIEYPDVIEARSLSLADFAVQGRSVTDVLTASTPDPASAGPSGALWHCAQLPSAASWRPFSMVCTV